ncbi:MAG: hypothetical protein E6Q98_04300 [Rhodospirillaceae bacterium]|nr:MAG: hypothetical protein E6Q98_04300 [Rhodospirillaceae bacterium]
MSLTGALNSAVASLRLNQSALQLLSSNVAHADDPNYTKRSIIQQSLYYGSDQVGGVGIAGYANAVNESLRKQYEGLTAKDGMSSTQADYLSRVQDLLGSSTDSAGLPTLFTDFVNAWQTFQSEPDSSAAQSEVISKGNQFAQEINRLADGIDQLDRDVRTDTDNSVKQFNDLLDQVYAVNVKLKSSDPNDPGHGDLIDQRDQLVRQVAQYADVRTVERDNGSIALFTTGGLSLVDGPPQKFSFNGTNIISVESGQPIDGQLRDGKLKALLNFRADNSAKNQAPSSDPASEVIRKLKSQLDGLVSAFTSVTGNPSTFAATYNNATQSQRIQASFSTTVQATAATSQSTTVTFSGSIQSGDVFSINVNGKSFSYTATESDTSLDQIAAQLATKINADPTVGITATNGVGSLMLSGPGNNQPFDVQTSVNGQVPELSGGFFTGTDRYSFSVNASLLDGTQQLKRNAASDVVGAFNNSDRNFMAAGLSATNVSYSDMVGNVIGAASSNAKTVGDQAKYNADTLSMTEQRYQSDVGVNLDEEIANLQVLQNAYAASARLLTVIQSMFDTLDQAVAR